MTSGAIPGPPAREEAPFSVALLVATRSRSDEIALRLPYWTHAGFDEVVIIDGSYDPRVRERIETLCRQHGATYVGSRRSLRDTRSLQFNLGARMAKSSWIFIQGDDDDVPLDVDKEALRTATKGRDWLAGYSGGHIIWHRREAFLAIGGYPEDMVAAEDEVMSNRARRYGRGELEPAWYHGTKDFPPTTRDPISRMRNAFWYGYTVLLLVCRAPGRRNVVLGDIRRQWYQLRRTQQEPWRVLSVSVGLFARALSPVHCVRVALQSGIASLRQEPYADWQGVRPS